VDDEKVIVKGIKFNLENEGHTVDCAYDGEQAMSMLHLGKYDLVLLDLMLPKIDGLEVCKQLREFSNVPVIMLTAKSESNDKLIGFEYGADDYVTKPFNIMELKARIRAIVRRVSVGEGAGEPVRRIEKNDIALDLDQRTVYTRGQRVELTLKEFDLLELLIRNAGKVYSRENLLNLVWGYEYPGDIRTVDVHVRRIREKIEEDPANPVNILTKWGIGYYFR